MDLFHRRLMQIILDPGFFLLDALLRLSQVVRTRVLGYVLHGLILIKLPCVVQELILETLAVHAFALYSQFNKHVDGVFQQDPVYLLTPAFCSDVLQHQRQESGTHPCVARDILAEDDQPHLVDWNFLVLRHEVAVHVHQDVTNHDHGCFMVIPLPLQFVQQPVVRAIYATLRNTLEVIRNDTLDSIIQKLSILVQDQVVRIPIQLLEGKG
mmetsp:Transcript_137280/g.342250  ORF Transcript_137280/g.342250 Transcript_137280/m.342250 type:complete len:211 (+) Transcript_137280:2104-2736(+)